MRSIVRTPDQAMRTFDQDSVEATQSALKSGKPKAGHAIKKYERAIIPFNAKEGNKSA
jgi:hypothetical protein